MTVHPSYVDRHLTYKNGKPYWCDECPCNCTGGTELYRVQRAIKNPSCAGAMANYYAFNLVCSCRCLISGATPNPIPSGNSASNYYASYPIYGGTGTEGDPYWKESVIGGPFFDDNPLGQTAEEKCNAVPCNCAEDLPDDIYISFSTGTCPPLANGIVSRYPPAGKTIWAIDYIGGQNCVSDFGATEVTLNFSTCTSVILTIQSHCCWQRSVSFPICELFESHNFTNVDFSQGTCANCGGPVSATLS